MAGVENVFSFGTWNVRGINGDAKREGVADVFLKGNA